MHWNSFYLTELNTEEDVIGQLIENPGIIKTYLDRMMPSVLSFSIQLVLTVVVLLIGSRIVKLLVRMLEKSLKKGHAEKGVITFLCSLLKYALYFVLVMLVLSQFGVTAGSVVAVLGSAGLTAGLALQGSLSNFAGGVLILLLKPFVVGDYIIENSDKQEGTVSEISIFYTKLLTPDNKLILIPNGTLSNTIITNVTHMEKRRIEILVGVAYDSDLTKVKAILRGLIENDEAVLKNEPMDVFVSELADSSIQMGIRVWVKKENYWETKWRLTEQIKPLFDENDISIPFPQLDVQLKN